MTTKPPVQPKIDENSRPVKRQKQGLNMDTMRICKQCQQPLSENAAEGLCPQCLAKVALGSESTAPGPRTAPDITQLAPHFPQLEILELLGMGGMGMVYKARQLRLDRIVALKILPVDSQQHPSFAERFNREAKALAKLNHPGIVDVYDFGQTGEYYYFVMEYVDGMNLRQLLNGQTITPHQALELVVQICTALQYAHDEGVVHRDIKPENIMLNKKGQVKIADFGLAKLMGNAPDTALTMSQAAMGTLNYMAPEQRQNAQGVDHRADIYSLGVVFYEMLTGEVPMGRFEPPSKRVHVDVRLDEVVLRALKREPARRYQQASDVKTDVESFTTSSAKKQTRTPPRPSQTERPVVAMEVGTILALVAVIGFCMGLLHSAWPLVLLLVGGFKFGRGDGAQAKRWVKAIWIVSVVGLAGYGVWITKSAWPVVALFFLFNWGKDEEEEEESEDGHPEESNLGPVPPDSQSKTADDDGAPAALPFFIQKRVWGPFGSVSGLMCLEEDALVIELEVKSVLASVRKKLREIQIPYKEIALVDFDVLNRLVLRTTRTLSLAGVPTSDKGEVTLNASKPWDEMSERAAKKFVAALNRRISRQSPRSQG
jgi:serine/threonine protein kinase